MGAVKAEGGKEISGGLNQSWMGRYSERYQVSVNKRRSSIMRGEGVLLNHRHKHGANLPPLCTVIHSSSSGQVGCSCL